jgi:hypothetical protein
MPETTRMNHVSKRSRTVRIAKASFRSSPVRVMAATIVCRAALLVKERELR